MILTSSGTLSSPLPFLIQTPQVTPPPYQLLSPGPVFSKSVPSNIRATGYKEANWLALRGKRSDVRGVWEMMG